MKKALRYKSPDVDKLLFFQLVFWGYAALGLYKFGAVFFKKNPITQKTIKKPFKDNHFT